MTFVPGGRSRRGRPHLIPGHPVKTGRETVDNSGMTWIVLGIGLIALVGGIFVWGLLRLRQSIAQALEMSAQVGEEEIPVLRQEAIQFIRTRLEITVELLDNEGSARAISDALDRTDDLKKAFAKDDFWWYFVLPCGALLGEHLVAHAGGSWVRSEEGEWTVEVPLPDGGQPAVTYPFAKVIKQVTEGDPGDVYAYLLSAQHLGEALDQASGEN